ncbi:zinc-binding dehydrogenase [Virgisporangium aurantiacum]|uniref:Alcohol dehydrogenase n=1 Tax=Virgisporangium aurantiacum TaxID=175570 RepID=A0A8J3ZII3_9ACTN|nr:zinc-binding dehydrogenase [Virgisporangium aurantiacum]GIJ62151.1 alcohol dehydrogenase [Virgisporangium aurantiacum]
MLTSAAVLTTIAGAAPFAESRPVGIETLWLADPAAGEVLVRVCAAGLCHSDLSVVDGNRIRPVPMVLGHEAAGIVEAVGTNVTAVRPGDHVVFAFVPACGACVPCQSGRPPLCEPGAAANGAGTLLSGRRAWSRQDGQPVNHHLGVSGFAEHTVCAEQSLVRVPVELPLDRAALFGCALLTGVGAVVNTARVHPGSSALVVGLGGVGLAAVMGARLAGCHPIVAIDVTPDKLALAAAVGATHVLHGDDESVDAVRELTSGGVDVAFEAVGSTAALATAYDATRRGGTTVAIGLPHPDQRVAVPALSIVAEERRLVGSYMGSSVPRRDIPRYIALYRAGLLPVDLLAGSTFALAEINEAMDRLAAGATARQVLVLS